MTNSLKINISNLEVEIEYSLNENHHIIGLNDRPFHAIRNETKKVEVRTNTPYSPFDYFKLKPGDTIEFVNETNNERQLVTIKSINKYSTIKELLETEGTKNVLSSGGNVEQGILSIENLTGYKENIPKYGVLAIEITLDNQSKAEDLYKL